MAAVITEPLRIQSTYESIRIQCFFLLDGALTGFHGSTCSADALSVLYEKIVQHSPWHSRHALSEKRHPRVSLPKKNISQTPHSKITQTPTCTTSTSLIAHHLTSPQNYPTPNSFLGTKNPRKIPRFPLEHPTATTAASLLAWEHRTGGIICIESSISPRCLAFGSADANSVYTPGRRYVSADSVQRRFRSMGYIRDANIPCIASRAFPTVTTDACRGALYYTLPFVGLGVYGGRAASICRFWFIWWRRRLRNGDRGLRCRLGVWVGVDEENKDQ